MEMKRSFEKPRSKPESMMEAEEKGEEKKIQLRILKNNSQRMMHTQTQRHTHARHLLRNMKRIFHLQEKKI